MGCRHFFITVTVIQGPRTNGAASERRCKDCGAYSWIYSDGLVSEWYPAMPNEESTEWNIRVHGIRQRTAERQGMPASARGGEFWEMHKEIQDLLAQLDRMAEEAMKR